MRLIAVIFSIFVFLAGNALAAGDLVIIAVSNAGDELKAGTIFEPDASIDIPAGGKVTLLSKTGEVVKLSGPYKGPANRSAEAATQRQTGNWPGSFSRIASLVSKDRQQSTVMGTSRKVTAADIRQPDFWLMAVDSSGHRCVKAAGAQMWRRMAHRKTELALRSKNARQTGLVWKAGENRMKLPQKFVEDGTLIVMKIGEEPRRFTIHVAPEDLPETRAGVVLQWMMVNDCKRQAEVMIRQLHAGIIE